MEIVRGCLGDNGVRRHGRQAVVIRIAAPQVLTMGVLCTKIWLLLSEGYEDATKHCDIGCVRQVTEGVHQESPTSPQLRLQDET